jgi:hypothetical protein
MYWCWFYLLILINFFLVSLLFMELAQCIVKKFQLWHLTMSDKSSHMLRIGQVKCNIETSMLQILVRAWIRGGVFNYRWYFLLLQVLYRSCSELQSQFGRISKVCVRLVAGRKDWELFKCLDSLRISVAYLVTRVVIPNFRRGLMSQLCWWLEVHHIILVSIGFVTDMNGWGCNLSLWFSIVFLEGLIIPISLN